MPNSALTKRQQELLEIIYKYIKNSGYPPTLQDLKDSLNVSSNQSVIDLLTKLERHKLIKRGESQARSIVLLPLAYEILNAPRLAPFLGISHAGAPIQTLETDGQWTPLSASIAKLDAEVFLLKVSGDSMINAGIDDGDIVLVKSAKEFVSKDIVLADVEGESTIKRFISEDKPPYLYLKPENPNHSIIYFTQSITLKGKVISVFKDEKWLNVS